MFHSAATIRAASTHCRGYNVAVMFPDVEPQELAKEAAMEGRRIEAPAAGAWQTFICRVLPALERHAAAELAEGLLAAGQRPTQARAHAVAMRRQAVARGDVERARFWTDVVDALEKRSF